MYQNDAKRVLTPECRLSYANLVTPKAPANNPNAEPKYSVTLLIPKSTGIKTELDAAMEAAAQEAVNAKWNGTRPARIESVVHDGDGVRPNGEPFGPECKSCWVVTASSKNPPYVCGIDNTQCQLAPTDIYSGMWARVSINFYGYNSAGKRGVGCGLRGVMKTRDDTPLSGAVVTASEFEGVGAVPVAPAAPQYTTPQYGAAPTASAPAINPLTGLPF